MKHAQALASTSILVYFVLVIIAAKIVGSNILLDWVAPFIVGIFGAALIIGFGLKRTALWLTSILTIVMAVTYPEISHAFHLNEVAKGKRYVADIAPALEKYKTEHGSYPALLSDVQMLPLAPSGMQYGMHGDGYYVIIYDPQDIDYDEYDSESRTWRRDN